MTTFQKLKCVQDNLCSKLKVPNFQKRYIVEIYEYVTRDQIGQNFIRVIFLKTDPYFRLQQLQNLSNIFH